MADSNNPYILLPVGTHVTVSRAVGGSLRTLTHPVIVERKELLVGEIALISSYKVIDRGRTSVTPGVVLPAPICTIEDVMYQLRREPFTVQRMLGHGENLNLQVNDTRSHISGKLLSLTKNGPPLTTTPDIRAIVYLIQDTLYWKGPGLKGTLKAGTPVSINSPPSTAQGSTSQTTHIVGGEHFSIKMVVSASETVEWKGDHWIPATQVIKA